MIKRAAKITNLLARVRACIEAGTYLDTRHSSARQRERDITRPEILYVLKNGWHEAKKDVYEERYGVWNYAVRGMTLDSKDLRVVVSFDENGMLIITAIDLNR